MTMLKVNPLYYEFFVDYEISHDEMKTFIANLVGIDIQSSKYINTPYLSVSVNRNELYNSPKYGSPIPPTTAPDRYLYYKYRIDVEPAIDTVDKAVYMNELHKIIDGFKHQDVNFVVLPNLN